MRRFSPWVLCALILVALGTAHANTVSFVGVVGSYGSSSTTIGLIQINGYYYDSTTNTWKDANLFGRNQTNDHGIGVCNPVEVTGCGTGNGGGDINELDNAGQKELIRLTLPTGYDWVSVQLSSLDKNDSTIPANWERGQIWADSNGVPNGASTIGDSIICNFAPGGAFTCPYLGGSAFEPSLGIPAGYANSHYLFFQPKDWLNGTNTNNDFLIMGAVIQPVPEPASLLFVGTGLVGLAAKLRQRLG